MTMEKDDRMVIGEHRLSNALHPEGQTQMNTVKSKDIEIVE